MTDQKTFENPVSVEESGQDVQTVLDQEGVNASGHRDQLQRGYGLISICGLALNVDVAWIALGSSLVTAISNGGPPGVIWELVVACFVYSWVGASIAELASSIPSAGGVYHWASVTPGKRYGVVVGYFAGFINFAGWLFDLASIVWIMGSLIVQMYALYHPDAAEQIENWQIFIAVVGVTLVCLAATIFFNRWLPYLQDFGLFMVLAGVIVAIAVVAALPAEHATSSFVWTDFANSTGWPNGFAFLTGTLNGSFTLGTVDSISHLSEELPNPRKDVPRAIFAQISLGFMTAFAFAVAIFYGINDLDAIVNYPGSFPLAEIFAQATGSRGATFGLLFIIFLCLTATLIATFLTVSRTFWALARDRAMPFHGFFASVNEPLSCPIPATVLTGFLTIAFSAIAIGSKTAFNVLVGSFTILTTVSFLLAIGPHLATGRKNIPRGWFWMGRSGGIVNAMACVLIVFFDVCYMFPFTNPTTAATMNYNSVVLVGILSIIGLLWILYGRQHYHRPACAAIYDRKMIERTQMLKAV